MGQTIKLDPDSWVTHNYMDNISLDNSLTSDLDCVKKELEFYRLRSTKLHNRNRYKVHKNNGGWRKYRGPVG